MGYLSYSFFGGGSPVVPEGARCSVRKPEDISQSALLLQVSAVIFNKGDFRQVVECGACGLVPNIFFLLPAGSRRSTGEIPIDSNTLATYGSPNRPSNCLGHAIEVFGAHVEHRSTFLLDGALGVENLNALMGLQSVRHATVEYILGI